MRTLLVSLTAAVTMLSLSAASGEAGGLKPGYHARAQLVYANGWALHDAGCLRWMPHVRSWYNVCAYRADPRSPVLVTKY